MRIIISIILVCATLCSAAQINFVKNPDFEKVKYCPFDADQIDAAMFWEAVDSSGSATTHGACRGEYYTNCSMYPFKIPDLSPGYQYPRTGYGMIGGHLFCDETSPPPPPLYYYRDHNQGRFYNKLKAGKSYCVTFWVNLAESSGYAHNKIGAYLDDGSIDTASYCGKPLTYITPQIYSDSVIDDTLGWTKIEGSFTANGTEKFITLGNFFSLTKTKHVRVFGSGSQYSYYFIDDVSVIESDLPADAGPDRNVPFGQSNKIGRVGDTTAIGLDCKWYHKGKLIDSGAIITITSGSSVGAVDTYRVVQTVCGLVKSDTVFVRTVPTGFEEISFDQSFSVVPNPSNGIFTINAVIPTKEGFLHAKVYDLPGRMIYQKQIAFSSNEATISLDAVDGIYILEITNSDGEVYRQKMEIRK